MLALRGAGAPRSSGWLPGGRPVLHDERAMHQPRPTLRAPLPVLRATVFAVVGTVLGVTAHHLLAEGPVPWGPGAVAAGVLFALGIVGARRPRPLAVVVTCSVAGQSALHGWLALTARGGHPTAAVAHHHGAPAHDAHGAWHERAHDSVAMTAAHLVLAVLVAVLLHRADAACWTLARGVWAAGGAVRAHLTAAWRAVAGQLPAAPDLAGSVGVPAQVRRPPVVDLVLTHVVIRRGPPAAAALAVI